MGKNWTIEMNLCDISATEQNPKTNEIPQQNCVPICSSFTLHERRVRSTQTPLILARTHLTASSKRAAVGQMQMRGAFCRFSDLKGALLGFISFRLGNDWASQGPTCIRLIHASRACHVEAIFSV